MYKKNLWELNSFRLLGSEQTQQLPTLLRQQCWKLLRACWQWCANGCNNSQQVWDLQCIVGRIQLISQQRWKSCQTDPTLLRYASAITEQKKCWELLAEKFDRFQTLRNNIQQGVQTDATCNIQQCWELLTNNVASVCTEFSTAADHVPENVLNFLDNCLAIYKSL